MTITSVQYATQYTQPATAAVPARPTHGEVEGRDQRRKPELSGPPAYLDCQTPYTTARNISNGKASISLEQTGIATHPPRPSRYHIPQQSTSCCSRRASAAAMAVWAGRPLCQFVSRQAVYLPVPSQFNSTQTTGGPRRAN